MYKRQVEDDAGACHAVGAGQSGGPVGVEHHPGGVVAAVSYTHLGRANIWPATVAKIYDCFKAGDLEGAQAAQDAIAILQQTFKYGNPNTIIKTAVALQGHNVGKCRAPFNYVPEEGLEAIKKVLAENAAKGLN